MVLLMTRGRDRFDVKAAMDLIRERGARAIRYINGMGFIYQIEHTDLTADDLTELGAIPWI